MARRKKVLTPSRLVKLIDRMHRSTTWRKRKLADQTPKLRSDADKGFTKDIVPGTPRKRRLTTGTHSSGTLIPKQKDISAKAGAGASARKTKRTGAGSGRAKTPQQPKVVKKAKGMIGITQGKTQTGGGRKKVQPKARKKVRPLSPRRKK